MTIEQIREQLPQLRETVYGKQLVYLDNAATSLRPQSVIDKWEEMSARYNANLHRAVHYMAEKATGEYENARKAVKEYISAPSDGEVVFTSGATASLNLIAFCLGELNIGEGDEVIIAESEHHSNIVPWQMMCQRKGAVIKVLPVDERGCLRIDLLSDMITEGRTKAVCVAHISNVLGIINPIEDIVNICHSKGCAVIADGAQGIVHTRVDVGKLDCDFYVFSGHKLYAAPGTGVLYAKKQWLDRMPPYMGGGEMIDTVTWEKTTYAKAPQKFEAGTQNIAGIPTLIPALQFAKELNDNEIESSYKKVGAFVLNALKEDERITVFGDPQDVETKIPLFSFTVKGAHHEDLALILDKMGIAVRSGQMCAEPLMTRFGTSGMLRASFAPYNTMQEAGYFIESLEKAISMLM